MRLVGGARWANSRGRLRQVGWPLICLTLRADTVSVEPSTVLAKWLVPSRTIPWTEVDRLEDARWGVRIILRGGASLVFLTWPHRQNTDRALGYAESLGVKVVH